MLKSLNDILNINTVSSYLIENLIMEDTVSILSGAPKSGKTTLALDMAYCISKGIPFLELDTRKEKVLYISLDDSPNSISQKLSRMSLLNSEDMYFDFEDSKSISDIRDRIEYAKTIHKDIRFVIIDMLDDIRTIDKNSEYSNKTIKDDIRELRKVSLENKISILLLHHNRKQVAINPISSLLGGTQLTGSVNGTILVVDLEKDKSTKIYIKGRDVPSDEWDLILDKSTNRLVKLSEPLPDLSPDIVKIINYITQVGCFKGTVQQLCGELRIFTNPRQIGQYLSDRDKELYENGLIIRKRKSNGIRLLEINLRKEFTKTSTFRVKGSYDSENEKGELPENKEA